MDLHSNAPHFLTSKVIPGFLLPPSLVQSDDDPHSCTMGQWTFAWEEWMIVEALVSSVKWKHKDYYFLLQWRKWQLHHFLTNPTTWTHSFSLSISLSIHGTVVGNCCSYDRTGLNYWKISDFLSKASCKRYCISGHIFRCLFWTYSHVFMCICTYNIFPRQNSLINGELSSFNLLCFSMHNCWYIYLCTNTLLIALVFDFMWICTWILLWFHFK